MSGQGITQLMLDELSKYPEVGGAALIREDGSVLFSSLPGPGLGLVLSISKRMARAAREGDLNIRRLRGTSLIFTKLSGSLVLVLSGDVPDGLLISAAGGISSVLEDAIGRDEGTAIGQDNPGAMPEAGAPPGGMPSDIIPCLAPRFSTELVLDADVLRVLRAVDGSRSLLDISRDLDIPPERAWAIISRLSDVGIIMTRRPRPPELPDVSKLAKVVYELGDGFSNTDEALRALGDADELLKFLAANLDKKLSVVDYQRLAEEAGLAANLPSVLKALESLRSRGIAKRKGEKKPRASRTDKYMPQTAISVLLMSRT